MHRSIPVHIVILFAILLGIAIASFIVGAENYDRSKYTKTICNITIIDQIKYPCTKKICNKTIETCMSLMLQNKTGRCDDNASNMSCYVVMDTCKNTTVGISFANKNKTITCLNYTDTRTSRLCWYNGLDVMYSNDITYQWYLIYTLVVLGVMFVLYIPVLLLLMYCNKDCIQT